MCLGGLLLTDVTRDQLDETNLVDLVDACANAIDDGAVSRYATVAHAGVINLARRIRVEWSSILVGK